MAVSGLRTISAAEGLVIAASKWGKVKTVIQIVAIISALLEFNFHIYPEFANKFLNFLYINSLFSTLTDILLAAAVIITVISGVDYFIKNKNVIKTEKYDSILYNIFIVCKNLILRNLSSYYKVLFS